MCLLCFIPPNKTPKEEHLLNACKNNPDGFGFAFLTNKGFIVERSMTYPELIAKFYRIRKKNPDAPALFHARLATHGTKNLDNCHPFYVAGKNDILLAHNGILPVTIAAGDTRSDTKVFAEDYMKHLGIKQLDDPIGLDIIENYCAGSKIVVLNRNKALQYSWYIINEYAGTTDKDDKCWYSNSGYQPAPKAKYDWKKYNNKVWAVGKNGYPHLTQVEDETSDDKCLCHGVDAWELDAHQLATMCKDCPATDWEWTDDDELDIHEYAKEIHRLPLSAQLEIG
jgi:predicted glutamine amidotransferase